MKRRQMQYFCEILLLVHFLLVVTCPSFNSVWRWRNKTKVDKGRLRPFVINECIVMEQRPLLYSVVSVV